MQVEKNKKEEGQGQGDLSPEQTLLLAGDPYFAELASAVEKASIAFRGWIDNTLTPALHQAAEHFKQALQHIYDQLEANGYFNPSAPARPAITRASARLKVRPGRPIYRPRVRVYEGPPIYMAGEFTPSFLKAGSGQ